MAKHAPHGFKPGSHTIYNGRATRTDDPDWIDIYSTWLAAGYRPGIPAMFTEPMTSAVTWRLHLPIPQYTAALAVGLLCHGQGKVEIDSTQDSYNADTGDLALGPGKPGSHDVNQAQWIWMDEPYDGVTADGLARALDCTHQSSPGTATVDLTITDASGSESLEVFGLFFFYRPADQSSELPT